LHPAVDAVETLRLRGRIASKCKSMAVGSATALFKDGDPLEASVLRFSPLSSSSRAAPTKKKNKMLGEGARRRRMALASSY
jgi:hypothetical protein